MDFYMELFGFSCAQAEFWWVLGGSSLLVSGWYRHLITRLSRSLGDNDRITMFIDHVSKSWDPHGQN